VIVTTGSMPREIPFPINRGTFFIPTGLRNDNWELYSLYMYILKWKWTVKDYTFGSDGRVFVTFRSPDDESSVIIILLPKIGD